MQPRIAASSAIKLRGNNMSIFLLLLPIAISASIAAVGFAMLLAPDKFMRGMNVASQYFGRKRRILSEEYAKANSASYRVAGIGFIAMAVYVGWALTSDVTGSDITQRSGNNALGVLIAFIAIPLICVLAVNPRLGVRVLQWDRYMDPEVMHQPYFFAVVRGIAVFFLFVLLILLPNIR